MNYMTFAEDGVKENETPTELSFWPNSDDKIFFEMQPQGNADYYAYQCMVLGKHDVEKMIHELQRILDEYQIK